MEHFAGLDVSVNETSLCIVDETGRIVREVKVASEPDAILAVLKSGIYHFKRIGLEAGPLSQWLYSALGEAGLPVICVETRHMRAVLKAQILPDLTSRLLYRDRYICVARKDYPLKARRISVKQLCAFDHVLVDPTGVSPSGVVDAIMSKSDCRRRVAMAVPTFHLIRHLR